MVSTNIVFAYGFASIEEDSIKKMLPYKKVIWCQPIVLPILLPVIHMRFLLKYRHKLYPLSRTNFLTPWTGSHISCP